MSSNQQDSEHRDQDLPDSKRIRLMVGQLIRISRGPSIVWQHFKIKCETFELKNEEAVCDHCNSPIKVCGGTGHLLQHYKACQREAIQKETQREYLTTLNSDTKDLAPSISKTGKSNCDILKYVAPNGGNNLNTIVDAVH